MKLEDYDDFCKKVIFPYIEEIMLYAEDNNCKDCIKVNSRSLKKIYVYYQRKRDEIKNHYMSPPAKALDRHKVAACMLYAILKSKVFRINKLRKTLPYQILMANEYLAVYIAVNIIEQYKGDELGYNLAYKIVFPLTYHEDDEESSAFLDNLCKSLYYIKPNQINIFAYSTVFFFMERYTDTINNIL